MSEFYYQPEIQNFLYFLKATLYIFVVLAVVIVISLTFKGGWVKIKHCLSS